MTYMLPTAAVRRLAGNGFLRKTRAVLMKEFIQLRRDRVSFAMIIMIPLLQLMLFGYAINTNRGICRLRYCCKSRAILAARSW